jgi:tetratricopeptide (TPR) repeat protein
MMHIKPQNQVTLWLIGLFVAFFAASSVFAQNAGNCGALSSQGQYGPYDYRGDQRPLAIVLSVHFTSEVEALIRGKTGTRPGGDIDYTLRAIPNHHRALLAMMRLGEKEKTPKPTGSSYTVECWFERALLFRPDDSIVRMIYSTYLSKNGRVTESNAQLEAAAANAKDSAFTHYNIGLHYFDLKNYDKALIQAHIAMDLGFTQTALRDQLQGVGKWLDPQDRPPTPTTTPIEQAK